MTILMGPLARGNRLCGKATSRQNLRAWKCQFQMPSWYMNSSPQDFAPFVINSHAMNVKWTLEELTARRVQEEERLKAEKIDYISQVKDGKKFGFKPNNNNQFKKKGPQKQT